MSFTVICGWVFYVYGLIATTMLVHNKSYEWLPLSIGISLGLLVIATILTAKER